MAHHNTSPNTGNLKLFGSELGLLA